MRDKLLLHKLCEGDMTILLNFSSDNRSPFHAFITSSFCVGVKLFLSVSGRLPISIRSFYQDSWILCICG